MYKKLIGAALSAACLAIPMSYADEAQDMTAHIKSTTAKVNAERIINADKEPGNWLAHGRTYDEQRFSPLKQINDKNVKDLGLAWYFDVDSNRGMEASPIVVDGIMYTTAAWSLVYAHEAKTGKMLWKYDPKVPKAWGANACCDVVNRGAAVWEGKVFVGTIDGRLVALDAVTGNVIWDKLTIDKKYPYTITGAPRVVKGKVIIGNGGAEYGVRGYVTAYDANTGDQAWRFYTVPGDPAKGFESKALEMAAKTWTGEWWTAGGGGTVWDSMAYDPELNLLYIGVGNGSPWNQTLRSPEGGDNLFLTAIVALNPDNGEYVWHYQTTPGETWDYTATQHIMLADLEINGTPRKVLMQAPKNGFFYVIDRTNGEFISAKPYVPVTWATHVDPETGRPVEVPGARYESGEAVIIQPAPYGGHNWHPMAYNKQTGLVYIPALELLFAYQNVKNFNYELGFWNLGVDAEAATAPEDPKEMDELFKMMKGHLAAWDPVQQKEVWRVQYPAAWNGGVLSTAGNLVFQGTSKGEVVAYSADKGETLWQAPAQTGVIAPPVTYMVDDEQYVTVVVGWGGAFALAAGALADRVGVRNVSRILTYKLGGKETLPKLEYTEEIPEPAPMPEEATPEVVAHGKTKYHEQCSVCHGDAGISGGVLPDLRYMKAESHQNFYAIVLGGMLKDKGMISFAPVLSKEDVDAIHAYVIKRAHDDKAHREAAKTATAASGR
ncbi:MAG: PQQ-dependent dehydrogenase, methanol/ethanol family [Pseudomonadota bacterium]